MSTRPMSTVPVSSIAPDPAADTYDQASAGLPGSPPETPTSRQDVLDALSRIASLHGLTENEYGWIADHSVERFAAPGQTLFMEGQPVAHMTILLHGEIHVRREFGGAFPLLIGRSSQITGVIPFSRMKTYGGTGYAVGDVWALLIEHTLFEPMLAAIPSMAQRSVSVLLDRVREVTRIEQQAEKLNALGKLAGNLAHELNNPASAAQRAASGLLTELRAYGGHHYELITSCFGEEAVAAVRTWQEEMRSREGAGTPAEIAAREEALSSWFRQNQLDNESWTAAPELSECGVETADLDTLRAIVPGPALAGVLRRFASSFRAERMAGVMLDATERIFDLINAIKAYSFMDQAAIQDVSIPQGMDSTLAMLGARLSGIEVERQFDPELPPIAAYGSELNQVWMALLENAIDAVQSRAGRGAKITLRAQLAGNYIVAEITDNGHGIPPDLRDRIFEPFFTTRAPGDGLGLGLDTVQRIIRKHRGYVSVESEQERTCFQVRLPIDLLQAY